MEASHRLHPGPTAVVYYTVDDMNDNIDWLSTSANGDVAPENQPEYQ